MRNRFKGYIGELKLRFALWFFLSGRYHILTDVTILLSQGKTSQIDHVVVSPYGIFVIETKNYKGRITIDIENDIWTQGFSINSYEFYSPIRQNDGHISALRYLLKNKQLPFINIVSFVGEDTFSDNLPTGVATGVLDTITLIRGYKAVCITPSEVASITEMIKANRMPRNWRTKRLHIKNVKAKQSRFFDKSSIN